MIDPIELHALADGEVSAEKKRDLERLLASSPEAKAEFDSIMVLRTVLREKTPALDCRTEWKACVGRLNEMDRTRKIERLVSGRFAWALAGSLMVVIFVAGMVKRGPDSADVHSADLVSMVARLSPSRMPDSRSSASMNRWLDNMLGQARESINPDRMEIRGAATGEFDGHPLTRLTLRDPNGDLALLVIPDVLRLDGLGELRRDHTFRLGRIEGLNCVGWTDGRNTLFLVGDRGYEDLATTASRIAVH